MVLSTGFKGGTPSRDYIFFYVKNALRGLRHAAGRRLERVRTVQVPVCKDGSTLMAGRHNTIARRLVNSTLRIRFWWKSDGRELRCNCHSHNRRRAALSREAVREPTGPPPRRRIARPPTF